MPNWLLDVVLPRTDGGVAFQALTVFPFLTAATIWSRRRPEWRMFLFGLTVLVAGLFGLRMLH